VARAGKQAVMDNVWMLLVNGPASSLESLDQNLRRKGIQTRRALSCAQARAALQHPDLPGLILTDTSLTDGAWTDILSVARQAARPVPVIVVSRRVDVPLYLETIDHGAADLIVPPLSADELAYLVRSAILRYSVPRREG
jgi:DNA-binding NtrC family response regulator